MIMKQSNTIYSYFIISHFNSMVAPEAFTIDATFANDVKVGLSDTPKRLSSKYFYDKKGDALFQQIMAMPEYYPTDCEFEIFSTYKEQLRGELGGQPFQLIELGAGDGMKTKVLLKHFLAKDSDFSYAPIDISGNVLEQLESDLAVLWPELPVQTVAAEYFKGLEQLSENDERKLVLFLGGNIGNMQSDEARSFLKQLANRLNPGDLILIGFDLQKDPEIVLEAYNDSTGITAQFNLNLLDRINEELGGDFDVNCFRHWATYDPITGETESYLISTCAQEVYIESLGQTFQFRAWEAVHTELSLKYNLPQISNLAAASGFQVKKNYMDDRNYFVDSLWEVK
ncbi:MAG: L-histidine N(alpha)-methyltransferase [Bacteroidota bacterium]